MIVTIYFNGENSDIGQYFEFNADNQDFERFAVSYYFFLIIVYLDADGWLNCYGSRLGSALLDR